MDLDLTCVASYLVLLDERHYGHAADRLNLTASALTKRIQRLERQVGAKLVQRDDMGGLVVTDAGRRFAVHAEPLLTHAEQARRAARAESERPQHRIVIGFPAGPHQYLKDMNLPTIGSGVCREYPETRLAYRQVRFSEITSCLVDQEVDMLLTTAVVRHPAVLSTPLAITTRRVGLVGRRHELGDAGVVGLDEFVDLPLLYNSAVPDEWMSMFYLGDVRPRREAQLVDIAADDLASVIRYSARGLSASVGPEFFAHLAPPHLRPVALAGAPALVLHVACRRSERRGAVKTFVAALQRAPRQRLTAPPI